jgi:hypothetical protein
MSYDSKKVVYEFPQSIVREGNEIKLKAMKNPVDTFDLVFNKELDLDLEEVPMVLFELHENAMYYIDNEDYEKALILLQKAQLLIEQS